jgi:hypothetical protein
MQDIALISGSTAKAYNETIQKADASLLAIALSLGSKIVDPLHSSISNINTSAEIC